MAMQCVREKAAVFLPWDTIDAEAKNQIRKTAKMPLAVLNGDYYQGTERRADQTEKEPLCP
jgi:hypothetical protein